MCTRLILNAPRSSFACFAVAAVLVAVPFAARADGVAVPSAWAGIWVETDTTYSGSTIIATSTWVDTLCTGEIYVFRFNDPSVSGPAVYLPCGAVPVQRKTWGALKLLYR